MSGFNSNNNIIGRIFIDMDGVIVDFDGYMAEHNLPASEIKILKGAYLAMKPIPGAVEAVKTLIERGHDVWIATKPPTGVPHAASEKIQWILNYLPELKRKMIITPDKGLLGNQDDFLIDDRPHKANCEEFTGRLKVFDTANKDKWQDILTYFGEIVNGDYNGKNV